MVLIDKHETAQNDAISSSPSLGNDVEFNLNEAPVSQVISLLSDYLNLIVKANQDKSNRKLLTRFHSRSVPGIDIQSYLNRIVKYAPCGSDTLLAVLVYFERMARVCSQDSLIVKPSDFEHSSPDGVGQGDIDDDILFQISDLPTTTNTLNSPTTKKPFVNTYLAKDIAIHEKPLVINLFNIHRLLIVAIMVAVKFMSDVFFTNSHVARVGGVPVQELNRLEVEFLIFMDFDLLVSKEELQHCGNRLLRFQQQQLMQAREELSLHTMLGALSSTPSSRPSSQKLTKKTLLTKPGGRSSEASMKETSSPSGAPTQSSSTMSDSVTMASGGSHFHSSHPFVCSPRDYSGFAHIASDIASGGVSLAMPVVHHGYNYHSLRYSPYQIKTHASIPVPKSSPYTQSRQRFSARVLPPTPETDTSLFPPSTIARKTSFPSSPPSSFSRTSHSDSISVYSTSTTSPTLQQQSALNVALASQDTPSPSDCILPSLCTCWIHRYKLVTDMR